MRRNRHEIEYVVQWRYCVLAQEFVCKCTLTIQIVEFTFAYMQVRGQEYGLELVDTAGQDEYSIFPAQYSMDIHGYVLVYSITSEKSFEVAQVIYDKILDMMGKVT